jgi:nucleoside 2-deoxyribosyltransferase
VKIYLASPAYNDPQLKVHSEVQDAITAAGAELLNPASIPSLENDGKTQRTPQDYVRDRVLMLEKADVVFAVLDQLQMPGHHLFLMRDIQTAVPFPEDLLQILAVGMQAMGIAKVQPKKGIVTADDPNRGMEVVNLPRGMQIGNGLLGLPVGGGSLNLPDSNTVFEIGYAAAKSKPVIALGLANPITGIMIPISTLVMLTDLERLDIDVKRLVDAYGKGIDVFEEEAEVLEKEHRAAVEARMKAMKEKFEAEAKEMEERAKAAQEKTEKASQAGAKKIITPSFGGK